MPRLPQRTSLIAQTAEVLREAIELGRWSRWLPGELALSQHLQVSRETLRAALAELEQQQLIRGGQGRRREIASELPNRRPEAGHRSVVLLSPAPVHQLPASTIVWVDELRRSLAATGCRLEFQESVAVYRPRPERFIEELALRLQPAAWVLYRSTPEMQRWFARHAPNAVIAGSPHPGIALSSVDVDHAAACRHAAGRFLGCGHRALAIVRPESRLAGDLESVEGFRSGCSGEVRMAIHDGSVRSVCAGLDDLFTSEHQPTGLFVFHALHLLTVLGWLDRRGLRAPRDVSVLCRDDDPFLQHLVPTPARYTVCPTVFARKFSRLAVGVIAAGPPPLRQIRIMPTFVRGETLGSAPL